MASRAEPFAAANGAELRIGVLGAARITKGALINPARGLGGVRVAAVAARDPERAANYATSHQIPTVHNSYDALLADPRIEAVYIPLPAALHAEWTIAAIQAGKHVLTEKPFTANAAEAALVADVAARSPQVVMEAYHTLYHPNTALLRDIVESGRLGKIREASARFCVPIPPGRDIRWNPALGGGGLLDVGYYPVRLLRDLFGSSPEILAASGVARGSIDRMVTAELGFDAGVIGRVESSVWSSKLLGASLTIHGSTGRLRMSMPFHPQHGRLRVNAGRNRARITPSRRSTYSFQLEAFRDSVRSGSPVRSGAAEAVAQARVLDGIYRAVGLEPRPGRLA